VYADWCIPCHELERYTYSDPKVIEALEPFLRLKIDATNPNNQKLLEPLDQYGVVGVPTILFLGSDGNEVANTRIIGYVPPAEFLKSVHLVEAKEGWKS
jgi:thioredoxin:protein disulfide reductase